MKLRRLSLPRTSKAFLRTLMRLRQLLIARQSKMTYANHLALEAEWFKTWARTSLWLRNCIGEQARLETILTPEQLLKINNLIIIAKRS